MGNEADVGMRGDINVDLTKFINGCGDEDFDRVIEQLDKDGVIDGSKVSDKFSLIQALNVAEGVDGAISLADKESIRDRIRDKTFFD